MSLVATFPGGLVVKNAPANAGATGDTGSILVSGRSPGRRNGNPLHYSCLEKPMDKGARQATVRGVEELDTAEHACVALQMNLEIIKLSEVIQMEKDKTLWYHLHVESKYHTSELIYETDTDSHRE